MDDNIETDVSFSFNVSSISSSSGNMNLLQWPGHQPNLSKSLASLLSQEAFADVTIVSAEGSMIKAHKLILSAGSSYFERVLKNNPCKHPSVITNVQSVDLHAIVDFIYNGEVSVESDRVNCVIQEAKRLGVQGIVEAKGATYLTTEVGLQTPKDKHKSPLVVESPLSPEIMLRTPNSPSVLDSSRVVWPAKKSASIEIINVKEVPVKKKILQKSASDETAQGSLKIKEETSPVNEISSQPTKSFSSTATPSSGTSRYDSLSSKNDSFVITAKKKKEAWVDPDAFTARSQKKRYRQPSLFAVTATLPKPKIDISKSKEFNGGSWSSQTKTELLQSTSAVRGEIKAGTKRKSDESVEGDDKRDKMISRELDTSATMYESPTDDSFNYHSHLKSPPTTPVQQRPTTTKPRSPLSPQSPGKMNKVEPGATSNHEKVKMNKLNSVKVNLDSTMNLLKDFDKIPAYKIPSPKKPGRSNGKKDIVPQEEKKECTCPNSELYELVDKVDKRNLDLRKARCDVHGGGQYALLPCDTPPDYWNTPQMSTQELYQKKYIAVGTPFTPKPRVRRRRNDENTYVSSDDE